MILRACDSLLQAKGDPRMAIVAVLFVAIFRFVVEFNVDATKYQDGMFMALADSFVFHTTSYAFP